MPSKNKDTAAPAATDYAQLLKDKIASGLPEADAKEVVAAQKAHDQALAAQPAAE